MRGADMIGRDVKEWFGEHPTMGLENIENACKGSIKKWEDGRKLAKHGVQAGLDDLIHKCAICFIVQPDIFRDCAQCFLYVDGLPCFCRGTYKKIYDYLEDENNTEYSDDFRSQVIEYADELIEYLREMLAEVDRRVDNEN